MDWFLYYRELMSAFVYGKQKLSKKGDMILTLIPIFKLVPFLWFQHQWQPIFIRTESRVSMGDCEEYNSIGKLLCDILVDVICTITSDEKNKIIQLLEILYIFTQIG